MNPKKILIVEDESISSLNMEDALIRKGYEIAGIAQSGMEAIKLAKKNNPDLMLVDIIIQGDMDGIETVKKIKLTHDIPFVYMTAFIDDRTLVRAKETEPYGYMIKPVSDNDLYTSIEVALYKHDMESKLKASEELYKQLVNLSPDSIIILQDKQVQFVNELFKNTFGYTRGDIDKGLNFFDIVNADDRKRARDIYLKRTNWEHASKINIIDIVTKDGRIVPCETTAALIKYKGRNADLIIIRDIRERKLTEGLMAAQKDLAIELSKTSAINEGLKICFDYALKISGMENGGIYLFNDKTGYLELKYHSGLSAELVKAVSSFAPDTKNVEIVKAGIPVYSKYEDLDVPLKKNVLKDKLKHLAIVPILYESRVIGCLNLASLKADEISNFAKIALESIAAEMGSAIARLKVQESLLESENNYKVLYEKSKRDEEVYQSFLNSSPDSIVIYDLDGFVLYVSPSFTEVFGWTFEELNGKKIPFIPDSEVEASMLRIMDLIDEGIICRNFETKRYTKDGRIIDIAISAARYNDHKGDPAGMLVILRDITEDNRIRFQLQQSQKMEAIGTLAGGIAHDFNNILSAIIGYTQMSLGKITEENPLYKNLNQIHKASFRAKDLVEHILNFSRHHDREQKPVQMNLLIDEALKLIKATIPSTIKITQDITSRPGIIMGDSTQIHQVIMNLCTNAQDAMIKTGGILGIRLEHVEINKKQSLSYRDLAPGKYLKLTVSDTGHGMDSETLKRIFEPFFTTKEKSSGTGMGLSTAHGITKNHGGIIDVKSTPGKGTVFDILLPCVDIVITRQETETESLPWGTEKILIIDDETILIEMTMEMLEQLGYHVVPRISPIDALETFRAHPESFDLVITDMTMPDITGDKLASEFMKIKPDIPIILCTGFSENITREKALALGIKEFLTKPIEIKKLADAIRNVLD